MDPSIILKSQPEIGRLKQVARSLLSLFQAIHQEGAEFWNVRNGGEMDRYVRHYLRRRNLHSAMLGFGGFPGHACISPNSVAGHGVPSQRKFSMGDIFTLDVAAQGSGWVADAAWTFVFPGAPNRASVLQQAAWQLTRTLCADIGPGKTLAELVGTACQTAEQLSVTIIADFAGHGIGRSLHEAPIVPFVLKGSGDAAGAVRFLPGMVVSIEPVVTFGDGTVKLSEDGWSYATTDGSFTAQYEMTVAVTESGSSVLTFGGVPGSDLPPEPPFAGWK